MQEKLAILSTISGTTATNFSVILGLMLGLPGAIYYCTLIAKEIKNRSKSE